jgi:site-specific DNA-methyltransferase (adenine-specific)
MRNKTINLTDEQIAYYAAKCVRAQSIEPNMQNYVVHGDFFAAAKRIATKSVDLLIVDPPYNLDKDYNGSKFRKRKDEDYAEYTRAWIGAVLPLLKETATVYVCCDWRSGIVIAPILSEYFTIRNRITWQREKGRGAKDNFKSGMEDIWYCTCGKDYYFDLFAVKMRRKVLAPYRENGVAKDWFEDKGVKYRDTCPSNLWDDITVPYWSMSENTPHPTQKPEKLLAKLILASSRAGDLVLDPFGGSGTTAVTAKKLGRNFISIERDSYYCALSQYRLERANEDKRIQGYDGVFLDRNARM